MKLPINKIQITALYYGEQKTFSGVIRGTLVKVLRWHVQLAGLSKLALQDGYIIQKISYDN